MAKKVVIVGGGFGGLFTALELAKDAEVTLISDTDHFCFRPLLYEYLSGEVAAWHIAPYYSELFDDEIEFIQGKVLDIDFGANEVKISSRNEALKYDALVLAVGGVTNFWGAEDAEKNALQFRTVADVDSLRKRMIEALDSISPLLSPQDVKEKLTFAIVGGGASGVELATKMSDLLYDACQRRNLRGEPRIMLLEMSDKLLPEMDEAMRELVGKSLQKCRVEIHTNTRVLGVNPDGYISLHNDESTETKTSGTIWVAGVKPNPLLDQLDLERDKNGLIITEPTLKAAGKENIFALGDIAILENTDPVLQGTAQIANQQATLLAENVARFLEGKPLKTKAFEVQGEALSLGVDNAAVLVAGNAVGGAIARQARFALYTSRQPTWHHRLRVGSSWFFDGTNPQPLGLK
jgi:demethylphylloquinone reductase